jgi:hypothetical protein
MRKTRLALATLALAAVLPVAVDAAIPRPVPLAPKNRATLNAGPTPTFKVRSTGAGTVWLHISKSPKRNANGIIKHDQHIQQMRRKTGSTFVVKPKSYTFPGFWAVTKGKYYWQSFRIACAEETRSSDCDVEGPVRSFTIH